MRVWPILAVVVAGAICVPAAADDLQARASALYDQATELAARGEHAAAASLFDQADRLAPNPIALKSALRAALMADIPALGMELVERAEGRDLPDDAREAVQDARAAFAGRTGKIRVRCPGPCTARLDGRQVVTREAVWTEAGDHVVEMDVDGRTTVRTVRVAPRAEVEVAPPPPAPTPKPPASAPIADAPDTEGISPAFFWVGLGLSAAIGAGTIASAVDTRDRWDDFQATALGAEEGRSAELRTNILFAATCITVAATAAVGIFAVDWNGTVVGLGPAAVSLSGRF